MRTGMTLALVARPPPCSKTRAWIWARNGSTAWRGRLPIRGSNSPAGSVLLALQLDEGRFELLAIVLRSKPVFGEGRERVVVDGDAHVAFDGEVGGRCAIEEVG